MLSSREKIVVVTVGLPHPSKGASSVLFFEYIKALITAGYFVKLIAIAEGEQFRSSDIADLKSAIGSMNFEVVAKVCGSRVLLPNRLHIHFDKRIETEVSDEVNKLSPEIVIAFDIAAAFLLRGLRAPRKIVWLGDLRFESEWHHFRYSVKERWRNAKHLAYALSQKLQWRRIYKTALTEFSDVIVASKSSEKAMLELGVEATFAPYPWPNVGVVDIDTKRRFPDKPSFLFFGQLQGLGSRSSLHFVFQKLYPSLIEQWGAEGFNITIGGARTLPSWVEAEIRRKPEISFVGFIADLTEQLSAVHAVIVPVDVPVGNRSRIITAQAKRALVIGHRNTALGNPYLIDGKTCYLASDARGFAEAMKSAVESPVRTLKIIDEAEKCYKQSYDPEIAAKALVSLLSNSV